MLFLYFGNVLNKIKKDTERAFELLEQLDGAVFEFCLATFIFAGAIGNAEKDYTLVKNAFSEKPAKQMEAQDVVGETVKARLMAARHLNPSSTSRCFSLCWFESRGQIWIPTNGYNKAPFRCNVCNVS